VKKQKGQEIEVPFLKVLDTRYRRSIANETEGGSSAEGV